MTEKRFTFADGFKIVAIKDNDKIMNSRQVCNKLNDLEEARSYYQENFLTMKTERNQLKKENKELSEQVEYLKKQVKIFRGECNRLTKENTELLEELND